MTPRGTRAQDALQMIGCCRFNEGRQNTLLQLSGCVSALTGRHWYRNQHHTTGGSELLPTTSGWIGTWCWQQADEHYMNFMNCLQCSVGVGWAASSWRQWWYSYITLQMVCGIRSTRTTDLCVVYTEIYGCSPNDSTSRTKSAVYSRNWIGPRMDHCGTPNKTSKEVEVDPSQRSYFVWLER